MNRWFGTVTAAAAVALIGTVVVPESTFAAQTKAPITIASLGIETGPYATPGRHNDVQLAVNEINARGGIDGHKIQWAAYDANVTPQEAVTAMQKALGNKPTAIIGLSTTSQVQATAPVLRQSGVPVLEYSDSPLSLSPTVKVANLFTVVPDDVTFEQAATSYVVAKYHPATVGIFNSDDTGSNADASIAEALLRKQGVHKFVIRQASDAATDVTVQALAMKGVPVVMEFGFPQPQALLNTALAQNGITPQIVSDQSGPSLGAEGLNKLSELTKFTFVPYCYPEVLPTQQAKAYTAAYKAAYPGQSMAATATGYPYDAVNLLAAAIKAEGGDLSASAIIKELGRITYQGACGTYHSDVSHELIHQAAIVSYAQGLPGKLVGNYVNLGPVTATVIRKFSFSS